MTTQNPQEDLNRLLDELKSEDVGRQFAAIRELIMIEFSSEAIIRQLEKLALNADGAVNKIALEALNLQTSQVVASKIFNLPRAERELILREVRKWQEAELLYERQVEVISRRYDFDLKPGIPVKRRIITTEATTATETEAAQPVDGISTLTSISVTPPRRAKPVEAPSPQPAKPRPSLTQVLLSETSIRIYLYLGAFFVIASAAILAALVESARLPILVIATVAFAGGVLGFKKRLPQPSFAFAIVFSCLLPIDAGVIADNLNLAMRDSAGYWSAVFLLMAVIWMFGTWFYESRMFSLASFAALAFGAFRLSNALDLTDSWSAFSTGFTSLAGLVGVRALKRWQSQTFALPLFVAAQLLQIIVLAVSFVMATVNLLTDGLTPDGWIAHTLVWMFAAVFYAASRVLFPFVLFPWMSAAALFPAALLLLSAFDATPTAFIAGFGVWGALMAFASEAAHRVKFAEAQYYRLPWLALSLPLFLVAIVWGFSENREHGFAAFLGTTMVYTLLNVLRARWYVWTTALLAGLGAYFTFFALPVIENVEVYIGFQWAGASLLLLIPELFFREPLTSTRVWNLPPIVLGILITGFNIWSVHVTLLENAGYFLHAAIIFGVYAALFAAHALRFSQPLLGYLSTASLALTTLYALTHYKFDLWMPALTGLAVVYYLAGFLLTRRDTLRAWGGMFITSGLALGTLVAVVAGVMLKETGGWYALIVAAMFAVELYTSRNTHLELFVTSLASLALVVLLNDFKVTELTYYVFGVGLIWLTGDAVFHLSLTDRKQEQATQRIGALTTVLAIVTIVLIQELASASAAACFAVYTAFFAAYAWLYKSPVLGYLSTAAASAMTFYALDHFKVEAWMPVFTGLTLVYYFAGFFLRKHHAGWSQMFRFSGLALGGLISLVALVNLEASGGWYALIVGGLFVLETGSSRDGRFEAGVYVPVSIAAFLILNDFNVHQISYILLALSLVWLGGDVIFEKTFARRKVKMYVRLVGGGIAVFNAVMLLSAPYIEAALCFGVYALFFAVYAWLYRKSLLGYAATASLPLAVFFAYLAADWLGWLFALIAIAAAYYLARYFIHHAGMLDKWDEMFLFSGLGLGTVVALAAPFQPGGVENALPIAIAATLFAAEAYTRRNVWLAFPANGLYLVAYFVLLARLEVEEPQYFSIGAAALGMFMHHLLVRAKSKTGAFIMGMLSQLVLLGTTYLQMVSTSQLNFFFILFVQSLAVLAYGIVMRSRSLVLAPIGFAVLGVMTVLYSALKDLSLVVIIGVTGLILLSLGILAVLMRERITTLAERFSDWDA